MIILIVNLPNLIYLIECKKCTKQCIGETKRQLHERFGENRRSIQNHLQLIKPTPVSAHFNQPGHSIDHLLLTPLELIHSKRDSVRKRTWGTSYKQGNDTWAARYQ